MYEDEGTRGGGRTAAEAHFGGKGSGGLCMCFRWGRKDDKVWGGDESDARESSPQPGRRLREGKVTLRMETGRKGDGSEGDGSEEGGSEIDGSEGDWKEGDEGNEGVRSEGDRS